MMKRNKDIFLACLSFGRIKTKSFKRRTKNRIYDIKEEKDKLQAINIKKK